MNSERQHLFVFNKKLSDSVNFRNYFPRIDQIPLRKLFLKFEPNRTTFYYIQKCCNLSLFTEQLTQTHFRNLIEIKAQCFYWTFFSNFYFIMLKILNPQILQNCFYYYHVTFYNYKVDIKIIALLISYNYGHCSCTFTQ